MPVFTSLSPYPERQAMLSRLYCSECSRIVNAISNANSEHPNDTTGYGKFNKSSEGGQRTDYDYIPDSAHNTQLRPSEFSHPSLQSSQRSKSPPQ